MARQQPGDGPLAARRRPGRGKARRFCPWHEGHLGSTPANVERTLNERRMDKGGVVCAIAPVVRQTTGFARCKLNSLRSYRIHQDTARLSLLSPSILCPIQHHSHKPLSSNIGCQGTSMFLPVAYIPNTLPAIWIICIIRVIFNRKKSVSFWLELKGKVEKPVIFLFWPAIADPTK